MFPLFSIISYSHYKCVGCYNKVDVKIGNNWKVTRKKKEILVDDFVFSFHVRFEIPLTVCAVGTVQTALVLSGTARTAQMFDQVGFPVVGLVTLGALVFCRTTLYYVLFHAHVERIPMAGLWYNYVIVWNQVHLVVGPVWNKDIVFVVKFNFNKYKQSEQILNMHIFFFFIFLYIWQKEFIVNEELEPSCIVYFKT